MTLIVRPLPFTVTLSDAIASAPASNLVLDEPALVYRNADNSGAVTIDLGAGPLAYDTLAIIGLNMASTDLIRVRLSATGGTPYSYNVETPVHSGTLPTGISAKHILRFSTVQSARYILLTLATAGTFVQAQRVVVGKALSMGELAGVAFNAEQSFIDRSIEYGGAGWNSFNAYDVLPQWKVGVDFVEDAHWPEWVGFLASVGKNRGFLFVPQTFDPDQWPSEAIFGRIVSEATANVRASNVRRVELTIRGIAP